MYTSYVHIAILMIIEVEYYLINVLYSLCICVLSVRMYNMYVWAYV